MDAAAEERAQPVGLADPFQAQGVEPVLEVLLRSHLAAGQELERRKVRRHRPQLVDRQLASVGEAATLALADLHRHHLARRHHARLAPRGEDERPQGVGTGGEREGLAALGELHHQLPAAESRHPARPEVGVVAMRQMVPDFPHRGEY